MLKGIINRQLLVNDTAFGWFTENKKLGHPDEEAIKIFAERKSDFKMIVFGGTWCEDTQNLLPQFYNLIDASKYPEKSIELIAVNKQKETISDLHKKYKIENVPTFIVMKDGKEIGRVVEYGKEGDITKELGNIVRNMK